MSIDSPQFLPSIAPLASRFDAFILDLWGVVHDGQELYPHAKDCLGHLRRAGKKIVLLSNAPRRAAAAADALEDMGVGGDSYDALITSGEAAYEYLKKSFSSSDPLLPRRGRGREGADWPGTIHDRPAPDSPLRGEGLTGNYYVYIGLDKDRHLLGGLDYRETDDPAAAHFLLLSHFYYNHQPLGELAPLLARCLAAGLPALCVNPDTETLSQAGERVPCAGVIAADYVAKGGRVIYFGKPHPVVYDMALAALPGVPKSRIVAVGDNPATDILGAGGSGFASVLVAGGILKEEIGIPGTAAYMDRCAALARQARAVPDYVLPALNW